MTFIAVITFLAVLAWFLYECWNAYGPQNWGPRLPYTKRRKKRATHEKIDYRALILRIVRGGGRGLLDFIAFLLRLNGPCSWVPSRRSYCSRKHIRKRQPRRFRH